MMNNYKIKRDQFETIFDSRRSAVALSRRAIPIKMDDNSCLLVVIMFMLSCLRLLPFFF